MLDVCFNVSVGYSLLLNLFTLPSCIIGTTFSDKPQSMLSIVLWKKFELFTCDFNVQLNRTMFKMNLYINYSIWSCYAIINEISVLRNEDSWKLFYSSVFHIRWTSIDILFVCFQLTLSPFRTTCFYAIVTRQKNNMNFICLWYYDWKNYSLQVVSRESLSPTFSNTTWIFWVVV